MKFTRKNRICRRVLVLVLTAAMVLSMAACGSSSEGGTSAKEWIWVPEFLTIDDENVSYYDMQLVGDGLYYVSYDWDEETQKSSQSLCRYSLTDGSVTKTPLKGREEENYNLNCTVVNEDGSLYGVLNIYNEDYTQSQTSLCRFDAQGNEVFNQDIADLVGDSYVSSMAVDGQGRLYLSGESTVWLFDAEGNRQGAVSLDFGGNSWVRSMGRGKDGKMYICFYNNDGYELAEIDFEGKKTGATYDNFPNSNSERLVPGLDKDFLVQDGSNVYEYDLKSQSKEELFNWLDSDINGNYVQGYGALEDGRFLAIIQDWETEDNGIAILTRTKASEVPQKENIVIASMYEDSSIKSAAVQFNKTNEKYHISIRSYMDFDNWDGNDYQALRTDAMNRLNNDITSNNCPDILDLSNLNLEQMAAKGIFEDLNGYLEKSSKLNKSDFLENVLEAYTIDGKLVSIPATFQMQTVAGKASEVGDKMGWTIDELIAYADAHPDAQLFDKVSKSQIMTGLMMYNSDSFVDWSTGECYYDSDAFKRLLEFVNRFPGDDEIDYNGDEASTPTKIQRGEVLLYDVSIYNFEEIQVCEEIFQGDVSYIGYPTTDGSVGCLMGMSQAYAITSKSGHKDGAWEFIESFLTREENSERFGGWGFSTQKAKLQAAAEEAVKVEYVTDENGEPVLDENGAAIVMGGGSGFSYQDGWSYEYRTPTQEEVDLVMSLMEIAKPVSYSDGDEVLNIINEEAEAYYKGQKSVDEVAAVIQSRVKIYVGENK